MYFLQLKSIFVTYLAINVFAFENIPILYWLLIASSAKLFIGCLQKYNIPILASVSFWWNLSYALCSYLKCVINI